MIIQRVSKYDLELIPNHKDNIIIIPEDIESEWVPIFIVINGTNNYLTRFSHCSGVYERINGDLDITMIRREKADHYRELFGRYYEQNIPDEEIRTETFELPRLFNSFPEKIELEKKINETVKEDLLKHFQIEKELNIELI